MARKQHVEPKPVELKDGSISWRVRFRLAPGQNPVTETFVRQDDAIKFAKIVNTAGGEAARRARAATESGLGRSIETAFEDYLAHAGTNAQTSTLEKYQRDWKLRIDPHFGLWPTEAISRETVEAWIVKLRNTETQASQRRRTKNPTAPRDYLSPKSIAVAHGLLSAVLKHEVLTGKLSANPAYAVTLPTKQKKRQPVFLSQMDYANLVLQIPEQWRDLVHLLAGTGLRWSEATALRPEDFDLDRPIPAVRVSKAWKRATIGQPWTIGAPKTKAGNRTVSLSAPVIDVMLPRLNRTKPGELLFRGPKSERLQGEWFREAIWVPAIDRAGINPRPRLHDLRHTHASSLIAQGQPLTYIQRRLGHESINTTSDVYGSLQPDAWEAMALATERAMALALPPRKAIAS